MTSPSPKVVPTVFEEAICLHCDEPIVRYGPKCIWRHAASMEEDCYPRTTAEPKLKSKQDTALRSIQPLTKVVQ